MKRPLRIGQLIAPFGPGAIYTDREGIPLVVCGLDHWFVAEHCEKFEFAVFEPRLANILKVDAFFRPADFRSVRRGMSAPPNHSLFVPAHRFPRWYRNSKTGKLHKFNLETTITTQAKEGGRWLPVRFVAVCQGGHLCEFPWKEWSGCICPPGNEDLFLTDRGGSELRTIQVKCKNCGKKRNLAGVMTLNDEGQEHDDSNKKLTSAFAKSGIRCPGERPWLGENGKKEDCQYPLVGALINQSNLYFPKTISAISIPDTHPHEEDLIKIKKNIENNKSTLPKLINYWKSGDKGRAIELAEVSLRTIGLSPDCEQIEKALKSLFEPQASLIPDGPCHSGSEPELLSFRRVEFNVLRDQFDEKDVSELKIIPSGVPEDLSPWLARVNRVETLRETKVFYGFDRVEPSPEPLRGMPACAMDQLFLRPPVKKWLPAIVVFGEGLYLELKEEKIAEWQEENSDWLSNRLNQGFITRLLDVVRELSPGKAVDWKWASRYLLVHSLAHILINQLVFECGYSSAALRERLYISDGYAPMAGILIYTASGDSEGTLGGLVQLGYPERMIQVFQRAISRASWCSADPVCSEQTGGNGTRRANLAACHACLLLPETACETINHGLDRAMVVGLPEERNRGFFHDFLEHCIYQEEV